MYIPRSSPPPPKPHAAPHFPQFPESLPESVWEALWVGGARKHEPMGRARGRGRGGGGGSGADQYGEFGGGQDREDFRPAGGGGGKGGGDAGGGRAGGAKGGPQFIAHVPKFLQQHSHLLERGEGEDPVKARSRPPPEDWEEDDGGDGGGAGRGGKRVELPPPPPEAEALKLKGARQFAAGQNREAEQTFTKCVALCPSNAIYRSNRSAARATLGEWPGALEDAEHVLRLRPDWAKGFSRAGVAYFGLRDYARAYESYRAGLEVSPEDASLKDGLRRCEEVLQKLEQEGKHLFLGHRKGRSSAEGGVSLGVRKQPLPAEAGDEGLDVLPESKRPRPDTDYSAPTGSGAKKQKGLLSFKSPSSSDDEE